MAGFELPSRAIREQIASAHSTSSSRRTAWSTAHAASPRSPRWRPWRREVVALQDVFAFEQRALGESGRARGCAAGHGHPAALRREMLAYHRRPAVRSELFGSHCTPGGTARWVAGRLILVVLPPPVSARLSPRCVFVLTVPTSVCDARPAGGARPRGRDGRCRRAEEQAGTARGPSTRGSSGLLPQSTRPWQRLESLRQRSASGPDGRAGTSFSTRPRPPSSSPSPGSGREPRPSSAARRSPSLRPVRVPRRPPRQGAHRRLRVFDDPASRCPRPARRQPSGRPQLQPGPAGGRQPTLAAPRDEFECVLAPRARLGKPIPEAASSPRHEHADRVLKEFPVRAHRRRRSSSRSAGASPDPLMWAAQTVPGSYAAPCAGQRADLQQPAGCPHTSWSRCRSWSHCS